MLDQSSPSEGDRSGKDGCSIVFSLLATAAALFVCIKQRPPQRSVGELPRPSEAVWSAMREREQFAAIRRYRQETCTSLYEASKVIEYYGTKLPL